MNVAIITQNIVRNAQRLVNNVLKNAGKWQLNYYKGQA
jgi:hypothetical protein